MALGFRDCCNNYSYFYLSDTPTFVSEGEVYFIITDDGNTFCAQYVTVPSLNYSPPTYSVNEMIQFNTCELCISSHQCPTVDPINQIGELATITVNECACKTQFPLSVSCYTINPVVSNPNGGVVGLSFTGGVPPYKVFQYFNGNYIQVNTYNSQQPNGVVIYNSVPGGTYLTKLSDGNGDEVFQTCEIFEPAGAITITTNITNPDFYNASNGSVTYTIQGGTQPFIVTYDGNTETIQGNVYTINNISASTYTINVTDSGVGTNNQIVNKSATLTNPQELNWVNNLCLNIIQCGVTLQLAFTKTSNYLNLRPIYSLNSSSKYLLGLASSTTFNLYYDSGVTKWVTTQINQFDSPYNSGYNLFPIDCQVGQQSWKFETTSVQNPLTSLPQNEVWVITPGSYLINPTITISDTCLPTISQVLTGPTCEGDSTGTIQIIVTGIAPFTSYAVGGNGTQTSQTNYFNQLSAGNYNVYVIDAQGSVSTTQTVTINSIPTLTIDLQNRCSLITISEF